MAASAFLRTPHSYKAAGAALAVPRVTAMPLNSASVAVHGRAGVFLGVREVVLAKQAF
jgi:hypothetical protein